MSLLGKLLSYYYLSGETGVREALRLFAQLEFGRAELVQHRRKGQTLYLIREDTTVWAIQHSLKKLEKLVDQIPLVDPRVVLDVGANCGLFTVFLKRRFPQAKVYVFEPSPRLHAVLKKNLQHLQDIQVLECAISDKDEQGVPLYVNEKNQETNSLVFEAASKFQHAEGMLEFAVPTMRLDTFMRNAGLERIDVLKVDIQGSESALLRGGQETLPRTATALFEMTFLDDDVFDSLSRLRQEFPHFKTLNPVLYGADLLFYRATEALH